MNLQIASELSLKVLIPAHNEASGIENILKFILSQVNHSNEIIIVAENYTDNAAEIYRQYGVIIIERQDNKK